MTSLKSSARVLIRSAVQALIQAGRLVDERIRRLRAWLLCNGVETPFDIAARIVDGAVLVSWRGDSSNVGAYVVERSDNSGPYQIRVWVGAGALPGIHTFAWADTNIDLGGYYCYRITAQHSGGSRGCPAEPVCIQGCRGLPTPFDVTAIAWGESETRLWWKCDVTNLSHFRIERALGGALGFQPLAIVPVGAQPGVQPYAFTDLGVQGGVLYCYRIVAEAHDGTQGCFTDPVCAGTQYY